MKEYIEREVVLNHLSCNQEIRFFRVADVDGTWVSARDVVRTINKIPAADVVEVVRCKDCKHMVKEPCGRYCHVWGFFNGAGDDGYCNYGERRVDHAETD